MKLIVSVILLFLSPSLHAAVWEETHAWSDADEERFARFIAQVPLDVFNSASSRWRGIATDCADAAYTLRVIFAAENGLPVDFANDGGKNLSNQNSDFDSIPAGDARLRKFIGLVNQYTNTRTIVRDTYPVQITRRYVRPGALFVHPDGGPNVHITYRPGHVYYLRDLGENGLITYVSSTVPVAVRDLNLQFGIVFAPFYQTSGYRAWRWPKTSARPGYSEEQFSFAGWRPLAFEDDALAVRWQQAVTARLASRAMTADERISAAARNVISGLKDRAFTVRRGWQLYLSKYHGEGCMTSADYDAYSTPTRDVKLQYELDELEALPGGRAAESHYRTEISPGRSVTIAQVRDAFLTDKALAISEPEHDPNVRWGFADQGTWPCPSRARQYHGGERLGSGELR